MLNKLRKRLLRVQRINRVVEDYRRRQNATIYHERWTEIMRNGGLIK
jgi:hypothetical protein